MAQVPNPKPHLRQNHARPAPKSADPTSVLPEHDFQSVIGRFQRLGNDPVHLDLRAVFRLGEVGQIDLLALDGDVLAGLRKDLDRAFNQVHAGVREHPLVGLVAGRHVGFHDDAGEELAFAGELADAGEAEGYGGEAGRVRRVQQARGILLQQVNQRQFGGDVRSVVCRKGRHFDAVLLHALAEFQGYDFRNRFPRLLRSPHEVTLRPFQPGFPEIDALDAEFQGSLRVVMVRVGVGEEDHLDIRPFRNHVGGRRSEVEQDLPIGENAGVATQLAVFRRTEPVGGAGAEETDMDARTGRYIHHGSLVPHREAPAGTAALGRTVRGDLPLGEVHWIECCRGDGRDGCEAEKLPSFHGGSEKGTNGSLSQR